MSSSNGLRRALSPKRSLRLDSQGSDSSGLSRLSFTGSRKRTRKQSKLHAAGLAADVDPQAFFEDWKVTPQEEVRTQLKRNSLVMQGSCIFDGHTFVYRTNRILIG